MQEQLYLAARLRYLWAVSIAPPVLIAFLLLCLWSLYTSWKSPAVPPLATRVGLAVGFWLVVTPLLLAFHAGVNEVFVPSTSN